jgi:hypothetical protein
VEKLFERFQGVLGDLSGRVDDLKDALEDTASRAEMNDIFEDLMSSVCQENQTAVGRMKCMACGRDIPQVTGATSEVEARRAFGTPPNSVAYQSGQSTVGIFYQNREGFDSGIVETPRSIRPARPGSKSSKQKMTRA